MSSTRSVGELAELVSGVVEGDGTCLIRGVADLAGAGVGEISFFAHPRYESAARQTKAGALVVGPNAPKNLGKVRIYKNRGTFRAPTSGADYGNPSHGDCG